MLPEDMVVWRDFLPGGEVDCIFGIADEIRQRDSICWCMRAFSCWFGLFRLC